MKLLIFFVLAFAITQKGITQTRFFFNDYPLSGEFTKVSLDSAKRLFYEVKNARIIEYAYSRGGCDYRAHAIYQLLKNKGISTFKIWNFAVSKVLLAGKDFNTHNLLLKVKDKINLATVLPYYRECNIKLEDSIYWGYHVAPVILVSNSQKVDTLVIDPALYDHPIEYKTWVAAQLQPEASSYIAFLNSKLISFQTESQYQKNGVNCNDCSGNDIITGVFWDDSYSISQKLIEQSISKGRVFIEYYKAEIEPLEKELAKYDVATTEPRARALACQLAEMKNIISNESGLSKLPSQYQERYLRYVDEATKYLFK